MRATIRAWLTDGGFDWTDGRILWQDTEEDDSSPGWATPRAAAWIEPTHAILDKEFHDGYGGPECPRFIAEDNKALYFPNQYDGSTGLTVVMKDLSHYLDPKNETPYPGG